MSTVESSGGESLTTSQQVQVLNKELIDKSIDCQCARLGNGFRRIQDNLGPLLYGVVVLDSDKQPLSIITFYVSYSTWDGRFLYVDDTTGNGHFVLAGLKLLARIAVNLGCSRFVRIYS